MIGMGMGDEHIMNIRNGDMCLFQLYEDTISSPCIYKEFRSFGLQHKASIIATGYRGIARAKHRYLIHIKKLFHLFCCKITTLKWKSQKDERIF